MILCDIGNTSYHFLQDGISYKKSVEDFDPQNVKEKIYYICVNTKIQKKLTHLDNWIDLEMYVDREKYYTTMGIDRIAACEAVENGVIVDAGSAICVDIVQKGSFEGGFIYPGIAAMQQCYRNISELLAYSFNFELDLGKMPKNSRDAMSYGYLKLLHNEVFSYGIDIYLTGGDAFKLAKLFVNAHVDETLLFKGMKNIIKKGCIC